MIEERLKKHVQKLAGEIGIREVLRHRAQYDQAVIYVRDQLQSVGCRVRELQEVRGDGRDLHQRDRDVGRRGQ